jgi:hypothetical protein
MVKVFESAVIGAPVEKVWGVVRDFNGLPVWHPAIAKSEIEGGKAADSVGCIRNFYLTDGDNIREQLLALDDVNHRCDYTILKSGMALTDYHAVLSLVPVTETDQTLAIWSAEFDTAPEDKESLAEVVGKGVFLGGLMALKEFFA